MSYVQLVKIPYSVEICGYEERRDIRSRDYDSVLGANKVSST